MNTNTKLFLLFGCFVGTCNANFDFETGYGCDLKCQQGDVQYVIDANIHSYSLSGDFTNVTNTEHVEYKVRSFEGIYSNIGYCDSMNGYDGKDGPLGPCLKVNPGQTISVKLQNTIVHGMETLGDTMMNLNSWANIQGQISGEKIPAENLTIYEGNLENLIGLDNATNFDVTNLHFHGMLVEPHLFHPLGTSEPSAPWISVGPGMCYCYTLQVSENQTCGTFLYHIHRHENEAQQGWSGMVGVLQVGDEHSCATEKELKENYKIERDEAFVFWTPSLSLVHTKNNTSEAKMGNFTANFMSELDQITMLNNGYQPTISQVVSNQVNRFRLVSGTVTNLISFGIVEMATGRTLPLRQISNDGITFSKPYKTRRVLLGSGNRKDVLVKFPSKGMYKIVQRGIEVDFSPHNNKQSILGYINVTETTIKTKNNNTLVNKIFHGGLKPISKEEIAIRRHINFRAFVEPGVIPTPVFGINNKTYKLEIINEKLLVAENRAEEWILTSNNDVHPFHIHVNPFQVVSVETNHTYENIRNKYILSKVTRNNLPRDQWMDTILIPPNGKVVIRTRIDASFNQTFFIGKTVFHCHWMDHTDLGMMHNIELTKQV